MSEKIHVIKDENLGGVLREFVEVDRKAEVGEYIFTINTKEIHKVTKGSEDGVYIDGWVYVYDGYYRTLEPTDIVHIDDPSGQSKRYRMADRKAEVGERIIIVDADIVDYLSNYKNGDVLTVFVIDYDGRVTEVKPNVFDDKIDVIMPYEYCVLEPVHECDQCGKALGDNACTNSKGGSYCSAKCADADEETSPTVHEMLANLSERLVELDHRISRLTDICEQSDSVIAREVERLGAELTKLKQSAQSQSITLTLDSAVLAKLIEKGMSD